MPWFLSLLLLSGVLIGGVQAKEVRRTVDGKAGQDARIGLFGSITPDCKPERTPPVRIVQPPTHGTIIVGAGQTQVPASGGSCAGSAFPVLAIFYRPAADFAGEDTTILEFDSGLPEKQVQIVDVIIRR
ncbi:hypothetical protein [Methylobacterium sp. 37f]|uniref:hypothetical protein n=1 Tax=Methylobacterium sp. 37f TaxID=2817058 RepID=UPI001FFC4B4D|nr:hypothetical protein [Methylobacterium sp. 37f]MCK2055591.1 hypothetical protein [Methylobacterium sp. 37f]